MAKKKKEVSSELEPYAALSMLEIMIKLAQHPYCALTMYEAKQQDNAPEGHEWMMSWSMNTVSSGPLGCAFRTTQVSGNSPYAVLAKAAQLIALNERYVADLEEIQKSEI